MPAFDLAQTQTFFSSRSAWSPASRISRKWRQSMQTKRMAPFTKCDEEAMQKGCEFLLAHLARGHSEFTMSGLPQARNIASDFDVVRWLGKDNCCFALVHEAAH